MNDLVQRMNYLAGVVNLFDGVDGRKRMQKVTYLLQELKILQKMYDFEWSYYGVYSSELTGDLQQGIGLAAFSETIDNQGLYPTYKLETQANWKDKSPSLSSNNKELIDKIAGMSTPLLEVLSSIVYFKEKGYKDPHIKDLLNVYKGNLRQFFDKGFNIYRELYA